MGYQMTDVTWETRGEVGCRTKGPRRTLDQMRSERSLGAWVNSGQKGQTEHERTLDWGREALEFGGSSHRVDRMGHTDKIVMWKA